MASVIVSSAGTSGPRGNSILTGTGAPASTLGIAGDWYIDNTTPSALVIYGPKTGGSWGSGQALGGGGGGGAVLSVNTKTGAVTLSATDVGAYSSSAGATLEGRVTTVENTALIKSDNLASLGSAATARTNLGLGAAAVANIGTSTGQVAPGDDSRITGAAQKAQNLADLPNPATARTSLGLGGAATLNVGAVTGTVAAGDDSRLNNSRTPTAHKSTHATGGSDSLSPADIGADAAGAASSAVAALSALTQTIVKSADEQRVSTITVADDLHLFASLEANSTYRFSSTLLFDGPEAADASITYTVPAGATGGWAPNAGTLGTTAPDGSAQIKVAARQFGSNSDIGVMASSATLAGIMALPRGIIATSATPGLLRLRWSQQTTNASPVTLKAGSLLEVVKVSGNAPAASGINLDTPLALPSDQALLAWTGDPNDAGHVTAQSNAGVAGRITLTKIQIRKTITWSTIWIGLAGVDTAATLSGCYLGVYDSNGNLKGSTADLSSQLVNGSNAKGISFALTSAFTAAPGEYFVALLLNGTWQTNTFTLKATGAGITVNCGLSAPRLRYSNMLSGQTTLPSTLDLTQQTTTIINTGWCSQWYGVS